MHSSVRQMEYLSLAGTYTSVTGLCKCRHSAPPRQPTPAECSAPARKQVKSSPHEPAARTSGTGNAAATSGSKGPGGFASQAAEPAADAQMQGSSGTDAPTASFAPSSRVQPNPHGLLSQQGVRLLAKAEHPQLRHRQHMQTPWKPHMQLAARHLTAQLTAWRSQSLTAQRALLPAPTALMRLPPLFLQQLSLHRGRTAVQPRKWLGMISRMISAHHSTR